MTTSSLDRPTVLIEIARDIASLDPEFQAVRGPGEGDKATAGFLLEVRKKAVEMFGEDLSEKKICGRNSFAVDFFFEREGAIVEVALGLPNPASEFEKDILKALIAQECGHSVKRLIFISRPGGEQTCAQPGRAALIAWAEAKHGLTIRVADLRGARRTRQRNRLRQRN